MKTIYVFLITVLFLCTTYAQTGRDSLCVQLYPDSVCISKINISVTCGSVIVTAVSVISDSIAILQSDTSSNHYWCTCWYDANITIVGLSPGTYRTFMFLKTSLIEPYLVGSTVFTVRQANSSSFLSRSYISGCHSLENVQADGETGIPKKFSLLGNYPNPFNPMTIIRYQIHRQSKVKLEIFDELGRFLTTLVDEEKPLGNYEVQWNASNFSSGLYLCKLIVGNEIQTRKMLLVK